MEKTGIFNKIIIEYEATAPVKVNLVYGTDDGKTVEDYFFLESGKTHFEGFIKGYTEGRMGVSLEKFDYVILGTDGGSFNCREIKFQKVQVVAEDTAYLTLGRYKLGVRLVWGGGINFLSDSSCPVEGVDNMVNMHDTGRLIQQSYYGCGKNEENDWGFFNNIKWPYNPVQGGDRDGFHSRLIDVKITDNCIYIKAQPRDWGKTDYLTPSYMENWYIIDGDIIRVDNRFVDFSGWKHPRSCQELPAFYTLSYFDRFVFYDGNRPWQDDELNTRDNLHFWGVPEYDSECNFRVKENNTEVWSAWVSSKDDYGIGLYVPNVDMLKAGRNAYNASKAADDPACNYTAPLGFLGLVTFEPLEYSYLMTCGSTDKIRAEFKNYKDVFGNESLDLNRMQNTRRPKDAPDFPKHL